MHGCSWYWAYIWVGLHFDLSDLCMEEEFELRYARDSHWFTRLVHGRERERVPSQSMSPNYHGEYSSCFPLDFFFFCTTLFFPLVEIWSSSVPSPSFPLALLFASFFFFFDIYWFTFYALSPGSYWCLWLQDLKCFVFSLISLHFKIKPI